MKTFLDWAKANLVVAILLVAAILAIPVLIYFSSGWNKKIRTSMEDEVTSTLRDLNNIKANYEVPAVLPGDPPITYSGVPNAATTKRVREALERLKTTTEAVQDAAIEWNQRGKTLLIKDGLFPQPAGESARLRLTDEMTRRWPTAHAALLEQYNVATPPDVDQIVLDLERLATQEREKRLKGRVEQALTAEEEAEIARTLRDARLARYRAAASQIRVYGDADIFEAVNNGVLATEVPPVWRLWDWQHILWIHSDILAAIQAANTNETTGAPIPVHRAPVKRILSIDVEPRDYESGGSSSSAPPRGGQSPADLYGGGGGRGMPTPTPTPNANAGSGGADAAAPGSNFSQSHTGRAGWPDSTNPVYDVRYVNLSVVVASDRLPRLIEAISAANFMTVIDLDVTPVNSHDALRQGFDYGSDHTVRADIRIETVWIHEWMKQYMPPTVRNALGVPADPAATPGMDDGSGQPAPAPAPARNPAGRM